MRIPGYLLRHAPEDHPLEAPKTPASDDNQARFDLCCSVENGLSAIPHFQPLSDILDAEPACLVSSLLHNCLAERQGAVIDAIAGRA